MHKLLSIVAAAVLLAACSPSDSNSNNPPAEASAAASAAALPGQPAALPLPADAARLEEAVRQAVDGYVAAAEKQTFYFDRDGQAAEQPVAGGYYREVLGKMPDGRLVVQDFYQDSGKPQILPAILKPDADVRNFSGDNGDSLTVWLDENGAVTTAVVFGRDNPDAGWAALYRDGSAMMLMRDTEGKAEMILPYADGQPRVRVSGNTDQEIDIYYPGGAKMAHLVAKNGQTVAAAAWDRQGKSVPVQEVKDDLSEAMAALAEAGRYILQNPTQFGMAASEAQAASAAQ